MPAPQRARRPPPCDSARLGLLGRRVFDFSANTARVRRELQQAIDSSPQSAPSQSTESDAQAKAVMNQMLLEALNTEHSTLPFYLVIYTDKNVAAAPQLIMEFNRNGKVLGKGLPALGSPDKDRKIQYVAMTPLERFEPGSFTVRFIVKQGSETAEASASFVLK